MSIEANILKVMEQVENEVGQFGPPGGNLSKKLKERSIAAIMGGAAEWVAYMNLFATTPAELARLIPSDGTENDPNMREARAYLVANAVCAPGTTTGLIENVFNRLDQQPAPNPQPAEPPGQ